MTLITPYSLWLGNTLDGHNFKGIFDAGIEALVQLAVEEESVHAPRELVYCRFPLLDGAGNKPDILFSAITTLATLLKLGLPTLAFCSGGLSRSPAIAAAALAAAHGKPPSLKRKRRNAPDLRLRFRLGVEAMCRRGCGERCLGPCLP